MATGKAVFRVSTRGARRSGHSLNRAGRRIQHDLLDSFSAFTPRALRTVRAFAPHDKGRLERGMVASVRSYGGRIAVSIYSTARSDTGFDYLEVTRHGHRVPFIFPKKGKALRFFPKVDPGGRGEPIFRRFVRGYHPTHDWVESAFRALDQDMDQLEREVGRKIDRSLQE